ncbi:MAG: type secretion protein [Gammaproteobacteria bacterium]|jgi:type VI secretion system protein ImpL|nr:type secretion protein [Gammaproteobacteria bacterium]
MKIPSIEEKAKPQIKFATELTVLQKTFAGAMEFLKNTKIDSNPKGKTLFDLPWFLVLGGPHTGKSSMLAHSSLNFILTKKSTMPGHIIPTTRHCDLWVSREAVFFDTSGQFTLHDAANQGGAQLWESFLELLFEEKRDPLQGIILTLSLERLALQSKEEQSWHFQNISERLSELKTQQKYTAPIYLLLTKADCLAGFSEYFDDLSPEEREQPWGLSFNEDELSSSQTLLDSFTLKFNGLIQNLNERLMARLHSERDWQRRASIKDFPLQIESLKKTLSYFLHKQLDNFTLLSTFVLRGIYFTSAVPEEHVIDRLLKPLSQGFSLTHYTRPLLAPQRQVGESFFIKNLFKKVILNDQRVFTLQKNITEFKNKLWRRRTVLTAIACTLVATFAYWGYYVAHNINNVAIAEKAITRYQFLAAEMPKNLSPQQSFTALNSLFSMQNAIDNARLPKLLQWASHNKDLSAEQKVTVTKSLQKILSSQLAQILQQELKQKNLSAATLYGALKTYQAINAPQQFEKNYAQNWLIQYWQETFHLNEKEVHTLKGQLKSLSSLPKVTLAPHLLTQAYDNLLQLPPEKLANAIVSSDYALAHPPLIIKLPTPQTLFQFKHDANNYNIPAEFTKENFMAIYDHELPNSLKQLKNGNPVLKGQILPAFDENETLQKARENYMAQYTATWQPVAQSIQLKDSTNLNEIQASLSQILDARSALSVLLTAIRDNTNVLYQGMPTPISLAFENATLSSAATLNKDWYHDLNRLNHLINNVNTSAHPAEKAFSLAQYRMTHMKEVDIFSDLGDKSASLPPVWKSWSQQLTTQAWLGLLQKSQDYIEGAWQEQVWPMYDKNIAHHFPIDMNAQAEITSHDFESFFAPKGTFNLYLTQYLDAFIDKTDPTQWQTKTRDNAGLTLSADTLQALRQTALITQLFFNNQPHLATVQLALVPTLPKDIDTVTIAANGNTTVYNHQTADPVTLSWPPSDNKLALNITHNTGKTESFQADGLWAWVKLINLAKLQPPTSTTEIIFSLPAEGKERLQYTLTSLNTPINPFVPGLLQGAVLPEKIGN